MMLEYYLKTSERLPQRHITTLDCIEPLRVLALLLNRNLLTASASFSGTPLPLSYITPRLKLADLYPCSAANRYHLTASASFFSAPTSSVIHIT